MKISNHQMINPAASERLYRQQQQTPQVPVQPDGAVGGSVPAPQRDGLAPSGRAAGESLSAAQVLSAREKETLAALFHIDSGHPAGYGGRRTPRVPAGLLMDIKG